MAFARKVNGERLFNPRIRGEQFLFGFKDLIASEQKGLAKRTMMPPLGEGKPFDGGLLDRLNGELDLRINPVIFSLFGLTATSDSILVEMNDRASKSAPLIFLFNNKGSSRTVKVDKADTTFVINREPGSRRDLIAKNIGVGGVVKDLTGKKRTVGIRYELPHPNWRSELKPGTAVTIDFSISQKEAEQIKVGPEILKNGSPITDLEEPHTAGLITKKMITDIENPQHFIRLSINRLKGEFVLEGNLNNDLKLSSENGMLVITLLNKAILKIPENALIE